RDTRSAETVAFHLRRESDKVARRLRRAGLCARGVRVKLKRHDFKLLSRQRVLPEPTDVADDLYRTAMALLGSFGPLPSIRLVGLAAFDLESSDAANEQPDLLAGNERKRALEIALDKLADRFGENVVTRA